MAEEISIYFLLQTKKIFSNRQEAKFGGGNPNTFYNFYRGMRSNLAEEIRIAFEKFLIGETQRQEAKFGGGNPNTLYDTNNFLEIYEA